MSADVIRLDCVSAEWLADQLDSRGVVRLRDVISGEWLAALRDSVTEHIAAHGDGDLLIGQPGQETGSPTQQAISDPSLQRLFRETVTLRWPDADTSQSIKSGIPVRAGTGVAARANRFHYDTSALTTILPIFIPDAGVGSCGELVAIPNKRPFRRNVGSHLVDILRSYNSVYRHHVKRKALADPATYVVDLKPGDAYLFWGYRTYHGNLVCAPGLLRAVLVLQYANVHPGSRAMDMVWRFGSSRRAVRRFQYRPAAPADTADAT